MKKVGIIVLQLKYTNLLRWLRENPITLSEPRFLYWHLPTTLTLVTHHLGSGNIYDS